jgi:hypothetical protein
VPASTRISSGRTRPELGRSAQELWLAIAPPQQRHGPRSRQHAEGQRRLALHAAAVAAQIDQQHLGAARAQIDAGAAQVGAHAARRAQIEARHAHDADAPLAMLDQLLARHRGGVAGRVRLVLKAQERVGSQVARVRIVGASQHVQHQGEPALGRGQRRATRRGQPIHEREVAALERSQEPLARRRRHRSGSRVAAQRQPELSEQTRRQRRARGRRYVPVRQDRRHPLRQRPLRRGVGRRARHARAGAEQRKDPADACAPTPHAADASVAPPARQRQPRASPACARV